MKPCSQSTAVSRECTLLTCFGLATPNVAVHCVARLSSRLRVSFLLPPSSMSRQTARDYSDFPHRLRTIPTYRTKSHKKVPTRSERNYMRGIMELPGA
eukprot:2208442-Pleurochrysis_carterae.AAC.2